MRSSRELYRYLIRSTQKLPLGTQHYYSATTGVGGFLVDTDTNSNVQVQDENSSVISANKNYQDLIANLERGTDSLNSAVENMLHHIDAVVSGKLVSKIKDIDIKAEDLERMTFQEKTTAVDADDIVSHLRSDITALQTEAELLLESAQGIAGRIVEIMGHVSVGNIEAATKSAEDYLRELDKFNAAITKTTLLNSIVPSDDHIQGMSLTDALNDEKIQEELDGDFGSDSSSDSSSNSSSSSDSDSDSDDDDSGGGDEKYGSKSDAVSLQQKLAAADAGDIVSHLRSDITALQNEAKLLQESAQGIAGRIADIMGHVSEGNIEAATKSAEDYLKGLNKFDAANTNPTLLNSTDPSDDNI